MELTKEQNELIVGYVIDSWFSSYEPDDDPNLIYNSLMEKPYSDMDDFLESFQAVFIEEKEVWTYCSLTQLAKELNRDTRSLQRLVENLI